MRSASSGSTLAVGTILLGAILAGCSASGADPAFEFAEVVAARECADGRSCVEVRARVVGNHEGNGSCALYGPGDPEAVERLAESGDLEIRPGEAITWRVDLDGIFEVSDLNPVCEPMIEG